MAREARAGGRSRPRPSSTVGAGRLVTGILCAAAVLAAAVTGSGCGGTGPVQSRARGSRAVETTETRQATTATRSAEATAGDSATSAAAESTLTAFDAFWCGVLAETRAVPLRPTLTLRPDLAEPGVIVYDATYFSLDGVRIHGFYACPRSQPAGRKLAAVVLLHGYGDHAYSSWAARFAKRGLAAISIDERGHGSSTKQIVYGKTRTYKPGFPGLMVDHITNPRLYSMVGIVADSDRAIDFLVSRPEVDAQRIGLTGGSMGGAMSVIIPALDNRVKAAAGGVPYLSDIPDSIRRAKADPFLEVTRYLDERPQDRAKVMRTLSFVDTVNFAPKVKIPVLIGVGMQDYICPPPGIFKMYRRLRGPKQILVRRDEGHVVLTGWRERVFEWMEKYL